MNTRDILNVAEEHLTKNLINTSLDIVTIGKPESFEAIKTLVPILSKLSPLYANSIEYTISGQLNNAEWPLEGRWMRQDPGFPDVVFKSSDLSVTPGIEIKVWFPLATEITARFRESQTLFKKDNVDVAMIVWMPENVVWGKARIIDIQYFTAKSVAEARDEHYHNPPDYIVIEPRDTRDRTRNLQQTITNGFKMQDKSQMWKAQSVVDGWGPEGLQYSTDSEYQQKLSNLQNQFSYRGDTNYAKMDRIQHEGLEKFKTNISSYSIRGKTISQWAQILKSPDEPMNRATLEELIK